MNPVVMRLIKHFGTQVAVAVAVGVDQTTVSGWLRGKHAISFESAVRIQIATSGAFQAVELCPEISKLSPTLNANVRQISPLDQSTDGAGVLSSGAEVA
jgi:DNA-binding transcriptional regulator YdaS (Cro superfamily)